MKSIWAACEVTDRILDQDEQPIRYLSSGQLKIVSIPASQNDEITRRIDDMRRF